MVRGFTWRRMAAGVVRVASALALSGSLAAVALAAQPGPLVVDDAGDAFAIEGNASHAGAAGVFGRSQAGPGLSGRSESVYAGVMGFSRAGNGVEGIAASQVAGAPTAGVLGQDETAAGSNFGVEGTTRSLNGSGVAGIATHGGSGVYAQSDYGSALVALSSHGEATLSGEANAVYPFQTCCTPAAVFGKLFNGGFGVYGYGGGGSGVGGYGNVGVTGTGAVGMAGYSTQRTALYLEASGGNEIEAYCAQDAFGNDHCLGGKNATVMSLDALGNMRLAGTIVAANVTQRTASASTGASRVAYDATAATPTLEDAGEALLSNGAAIVRFDRAFADSIERGSTYMVFITPLGDTRGWLYVAKRTALGFEVREHGGARSTVAFDYRIVARPVGRHARRLPNVVEPALDPRALAAVRSASRGQVASDPR